MYPPYPSVDSFSTSGTLFLKRYGKRHGVFQRIGDDTAFFRDGNQFFHHGAILVLCADFHINGSIARRTTFKVSGNRHLDIGYDDIPSPVPSHRLKVVRRTVQDMFMIETLRARGEGGFADSVMTSVLVSALCSDFSPEAVYLDGTSCYARPWEDSRGRGKWSRDPAEWDRARRAFARRIMETNP